MSLSGRGARRIHFARIEKKYGKDVKAVIEEMRQKRNRWRSIAETLGVEECTLLEWRRFFGMPITHHIQVRGASLRPRKKIVRTSTRRGKNKTLEMERRIRDIEEEFSEPLADIVIGMRQQGCSWKTIAGALEIGYTSLLKWRKRFNFAPPNRSDWIREDRENGRRFVDDIARRMEYKDFEDLYRHLRLVKRMSVDDVARAMGVSSITIRKWTPPDLKGMRIKTEKSTQIAKKNLEKARLTKSSPWIGQKVVVGKNVQSH